jgi:hypothetical protein
VPWPICWARTQALRQAQEAEIHKLYRCHDRLLAHKQAVFDHLTGRWRDLCNISYDVLLYDLTITYFEADPPFPEGDKRRFGYSRDHRPDCVQILIALVVTPEGLPLAYEALPGNAGVSRTPRASIRQGAPDLADRPRCADRGSAHRNARGRPAGALSGGHAKGSLDAFGKASGRPAMARGATRRTEPAPAKAGVKLLAQEGELYVLAQSRDRVAKERAMRRRRLKRLWARLKQLSTMQLTREELLMKLGAARDQSGIAWRLAVIQIAADTATWLSPSSTPRWMRRTRSGT